MPTIMRNLSTYSRAILCQKTLNLTKNWQTYGGWLVGEEEEQEGYVPQSIFPPILIGIQCRRCQSLFSIPGDYLGAFWQFLDSVKCHWSENYLTYVTVEGLTLGTKK